MTRKVVTVEMDDTLGTLWEIFRNVKFHHLLVVEDGELRGVISDRDLLKASSPFVNTFAEQKRDLTLLKKRAHQIMSRKPITIGKEATSEEASQLMLRSSISCLPVISAEGSIDGIITWRDLLTAYGSKRVSDTEEGAGRSAAPPARVRRTSLPAGVLRRPRPDIP
ncbi:MAG: CBS domain-containing protein [Phycisphaerales bacterium]|nr:MAG: CBS domain-containing protein [Phycisphaerales bacterium]